MAKQIIPDEIKVSSLVMSVRAESVLTFAGFETVGDVRRFAKQGRPIRLLKNCGVKTEREICGLFDIPLMKTGEKPPSVEPSIFLKVCGDAKISFRLGRWGRRKGLVIISNGDDIMLSRRDVRLLQYALDDYLNTTKKETKQS